MPKRSADADEVWGSREQAPASRPECEVCSWPLPDEPEKLVMLQALNLCHLKGLRTISEVRSHDESRRRWLGRPDAVATTATVDWWATTRLPGSSIDFERLADEADVWRNLLSSQRSEWPVRPESELSPKARAIRDGLLKAPVGHRGEVFAAALAQVGKEGTVGRDSAYGRVCTTHNRWVGRQQLSDPCWKCVWPQALKAAKP